MRTKCLSYAVLYTYHYYSYMYKSQFWTEKNLIQNTTYHCSTLVVNFLAVVLREHWLVIIQINIFQEYTCMISRLKWKTLHSNVESHTAINNNLFLSFFMQILISGVTQFGRFLCSMIIRPQLIQNQKITKHLKCTYHIFKYT